MTHVFNEIFSHVTALAAMNQFPSLTITACAPNDINDSVFGIRLGEGYSNVPQKGPVVCIRKTWKEGLLTELTGKTNDTDPRLGKLDLKRNLQEEM